MCELIKYKSFDGLEIEALLYRARQWNGQLPYALGSGTFPLVQPPQRPPSQIQNQTHNETQLR
jgi:hypothetical protein